MKKTLVLFMVMLLTISFCACGSADSPSSANDEGKGTKASVQDEKKDLSDESITKVSIGQSIETDSFKMVVESMELYDDYEFNTNEYTTRSLPVEKGYKLLMVQGTIENTGMTVISDQSFAKEVIVNGNYVVDDNDVDLYFERSNSFELDPYTEQRYDLFINIPEKLAEQFETATFKLGFKDDLSYITKTYKSDGTNSNDATNWFEIVK
ncbi:MAG: hypothetical protein K5767_08630 [Clostridia bacterium]|nr:hypothetical protein [Clostridia bacterium]